MRERDRLEREHNLRILEKEGRRGDELQEQRLFFEQLSDDFMRIQIVNNKLREAVSNDGALDLALVAQSASEIRKRAGWLKDNLVLPEPEKSAKRTKVKVGADAEQLMSSLSALDELIVGFVRNPVFKEVNVVDAQLSAKARHDLE